MTALLFAVYTHLSTAIIVGSTVWPGIIKDNADKHLSKGDFLSSVFCSMLAGMLHIWLWCYEKKMYIYSLVAISYACSFNIALIILWATHGTQLSIALACALFVFHFCFAFKTGRLAFFNECERDQDKKPESSVLGPPIPLSPVPTWRPPPLFTILFTSYANFFIAAEICYAACMPIHNFTGPIQEGCFLSLLLCSMFMFTLHAWLKFNEEERKIYTFVSLVVAHLFGIGFTIPGIIRGTWYPMFVACSLSPLVLYLLIVGYLIPALKKKERTMHDANN